MIEGFPWALYEEQGIYYKSTVVVDHLKGICEGGGSLHQKITHIRVFENIWFDGQQFLLGFEIFYDNQSGGAYFGYQEINESRCKNLVLGNTEYLMEIKGRFNNVMRGLVFITSLGREFKAGESISTDMEGATFSLKQGINIIRDITWGMGGYLHNIGAHFQLPPPQPYMMTEENVPIPVPTLEYKGVGKTSKDTIIIDHLKTTGDNFNKITRIRGWQSINKQYALGLEILSISLEIIDSKLVCKFRKM